MGSYITKNIGENTEGLAAFLETIPGALTVAAVAGIVCFMGDMNPALSTAVSREGRGHAFMLGLPIPVRTHIQSKLIVGYGLTALGIVITGIAFVMIAPPVRLEAVLGCVLALLFCYIIACLALARDLKHPKLNWVTEQEAVKQNFGTLISMLISLAMLVALGGLSYLLIGVVNIGTWGYFGIMFGLLAAGCLGVRAWLYKAGEKYYYSAEP